MPDSPLRVLGDFVDAILGYRENGVWPDNHTLVELAERGWDALFPGREPPGGYLSSYAVTRVPLEDHAYVPMIGGSACSRGCGRPGWEHKGREGAE